MGSETRHKDATPIHVRVSAEQKAQLQALAAACSCSVPALMRSAALGHQVTSTVDYQAITELSRLRGDLGRVGGLLKLWLGDDDRWPAPGVEKADIRRLVDQVQALQAELRARIEAL